MTNLKSLLLAGAVIPALALTPMQPVLAQAPGQEGHPGMRGGEGGGGAGHAPGGGMRGEGGGAHEGGAPHGGPGAGGGAAGRALGGGGMRGEGGAAGGGAAGRALGEGSRGGAASERHAPAAAERAAPAAAERHTPAAERHSPAAAERAAPAAAERHSPAAAERAAPAAAERHTPAAAERAAPAAAERHAPASAERAAPAAGAGGAEGRSPRDEHQQGRGDQAPRGGTHNEGERGTAGAPAATPTPRAGENLDRTPGTRGPNGGAPGVGDRGPGGPGDHGPGDAGDRRFGNNPGGREDQHRGGISPGGAAAIGAAAGFVGGFMAGSAGARGIDDIRRERREERDGDRTYIREPGRTIVEDGDRRFLVHDPNDRFRELGYRSNHERRGDDFVDTVVLAGGVSVMTYTTPDGRLLRRVRRGPDGRDVVLFENDSRPVYDDVVDLPPPPMGIPRDRYVVDYADADEGSIYDTLVAPPLAPPPQRYTLDQVLYSPSVRNYVRSVDINTINFPTGQWVVPGDQTRKLVSLAQAINRAVSQNPNSVFLIEGYTDAVGNPTDNLSLSDHRAQSVAAILTKDFKVPPENLTTQGYGDQNPKEKTSGPSAANRRVVVRNITQLLAAGGNPPPR